MPNLNNKIKLLILAIIVILLGVGGVLVFVVFSSRNKPAQETKPVVSQEEKIKEIKPEDIGLVLKARSDKKAIIMEVNKLAEISMLEYELNYNAIENGEKVLRGAIGSIKNINPGERKITREILLGTCSANVCKYDKGVSDIDFVLKVTYTNGQVASLEQKVNLE